MSGRREMDAATRHRYRRHLVEAEGVSGREADAFLTVLARGLLEGAPESESLAAELETRSAAVDGFRAAAEDTARQGQAEAATDAAVAALVHLSGTSPTRATPSRVRSLQDYAERQVTGSGAR